MAIAIVGTPTSAAGSSVTATTVTITAPTGSVGDMLLIGVAVSSIAGTIGSDPLITASSGLLTKLSFSPSPLCQTALFYRVIQSGDPTTWTFTTSAGAPISAVAVRYSGVHATTPFRYWNRIGNFDVPTNTATSVVFPVMDNVQSTDLVVTLAAMGVSTKTATISTLSTPSGWTSRVTKNGPVSGTTAYPVTAKFFDIVGTPGTPTSSGSTGHYNAQSVALVAASNQVPDTVGGTISFRAAATAATAAHGTATITVNKPTGVVDGDLMLLAVANSSGFTANTAPAGWTSISQHLGEYNYGLSSAVSDLVGQVWYKIASSEPSSYTVTCTTAAVISAAIVAYSGVRNPYPADLHVATASTAAASTTGVVPYTLPQVRSDNLIVNIYMAGGDPSGTFTMTGPSSPWTQRAQIISSVASTFNAGITVSDQLNAATQPTAATSIAAASVVFSIALVGLPPVYS
ncbi:MAG: hypothetical protein ACREQ5_10130, partial [Candidatus Dormibacteria bacterium]